MFLILYDGDITIRDLYYVYVNIILLYKILGNNHNFDKGMGFGNEHLGSSIVDHFDYTH